VVEGQLECESRTAVAAYVHPRVITVVGDLPAEQGCIELRQFAWLVGVEYNLVEPDIRPRFCGHFSILASATDSSLDGLQMPPGRPDAERLSAADQSYEINTETIERSLLR
jgi:hypothetical protein